MGNLEIPEAIRWYREQCTRLRDQLGALVVERDQLLQVHIPYLEKEWLSQVGPARVACLEVQIETRCLQRTLEELRAARQRGEQVDLYEVQERLAGQVAAWRAEVKAARQRVEQARASLSGATVGAAELTQIRSLYRKLVRRLHPDLGGKEGDPRWLQTQLAYQNQDLSALQLVETMLSLDLDVEEPTFDWRAEHDRLENLVQLLAQQIQRMRGQFPLSDEDEIRNPERLLKIAEGYRLAAEAEQARLRALRLQLEAWS